MASTIRVTVQEVSASILDDGNCHLHLGDQAIDLSPRIAKLALVALTGAISAASIESLDDDETAPSADLPAAG